MSTSILPSGKNTFRRVPEVVRYLLAIGVISLISFLYPNHLKFKYEFEKGQVWPYEDLVAPFDFAIKKSTEELSREQLELEKQIAPCYELNSEIEENQIAAFDTEFTKQINLVSQSREFRDVLHQPDKYRRYGNELLKRLFNRGIVSLAKEHETAGRDFVIQIIRGNTVQRQTIGKLLDLKAAKNLLSDSLPYSRLSEPDFLYPLLEGALAPNLFYSDTLTKKFKADLLSGISAHRGMVKKGEMIVPHSGVITEETYQKLISFKAQYEEQVSVSRSNIWVFGGYFLLTAMVVVMLFLYLKLYAPYIYYNLRKLTFILIWLLAYGYLVYVVEQTHLLSAYLVPFCIVPIVIKTFYNAWLALFVHITVVLIGSFITSLGFEFTFLQLVVGIVVLLSNVSTREWSKFFYSMLYIFLSYGLGYLGLSLIQGGSLMEVDWSKYVWIAMNVFLTLLAYPLIPLVERVFGFTSPITLLELSDMNKPLLRELALKAPGTLQHSLQVANLSEAAARKIGADELLVKVAALYHDIGKTLNPEFFIENQAGKNPHQDMAPLESAKTIIRHVTDGVQMAKKSGLPELLINFIRTHHGTTRVEYFYRNLKNENPDQEIDESQFRYPGPKPRTKEETIMMLADSIEAACKSLQNPTEKELEEKIDGIIQGKINQGQLEESEITFTELKASKAVFKQVMKSVHHVRIAYPEEKTNKTE